MQIIILVIGTNIYFLNNLSTLDKESLIPENVARNIGRKGMDFWEIFVLEMLRLIKLQYGFRYMQIISKMCP